MDTGYCHWQPTKPGRYRYQLVVDESNNVEEVDESNNILDGEIEARPLLASANNAGRISR